jgi:predicted MFS family arabinose efflux permease
MVAVSIGLVAGPIIGGVLSDTSLLGGIASLKLPFYVAGTMVAATFVLILVSYSDAGQVRQPFRFEPQEIFLVLWRIVQRPAILRISLVFFCFEISLNAFYIFMDNYLTSRFHYGTFPTSMAMMIFGGCLALSAAFLVSYFGERVTKRSIVFGAQVAIGVSCLLFVAVPSGLLTFLPIALLGIAFGVGYPTLLAIYSLSVDETEQGWVMGVSIALFTLGSGITSFIGGEAMGFDIRLPFYYAAGFAILTLILILALWKYPPLRAIVSAKPSRAVAEANSAQD